MRGIVFHDRVYDPKSLGVVIDRPRPVRLPKTYVAPLLQDEHDVALVFWNIRTQGQQRAGSLLGMVELLQSFSNLFLIAVRIIRKVICHSP
jgi:hypothetical protein